MTDNEQPKLEKLTVEQVMKDEHGSPRGFFKSEHLTLRPLLKEDLSALAALLAEDPCPRERGPWTLAKLEKAFGDEKEPGLWKEQTRYFAAVDKAGALVGYAWERTENGSVFFVQHWVARELPQRAAAGAELVRLHTQWLTQWRAAQVIDTRVAGVDDRAEWLASAGFAPDALKPGHCWLDGRMQDIQHYVWLSEQRRAEAPLSTGEPESSAAVSAVLDW